MASKVLTDETGLQMVAALNKIAENQGGSSGGTADSGVTYRAVEYSYSAQTAFNGFNAAFWADNSDAVDEYIVYTVNGHPSTHYYSNTSTQNRSYKKITGTMYGSATSVIFPLFETVSYSSYTATADSIGLERGEVKEYEAPTVSEILSTSKNINAVFNFTQTSGAASPSTIVTTGSIIIKNFNIIKIALQWNGSINFNALIFTDGVIGRVTSVTYPDNITWEEI